MSKRVPKVRFKGFTDEWEEHRLVDYFSERIERSSRGNMLSVTISEGIVLASSLDRKDNSSADKKNYKLVKVNDIAYNSMRMWQAALGVSNYEGIVSPAYTVLIPNDGVDSNFFGYQFKQTKMKRIFQRNSQGLTSDTWNLKYPLFSKILTSAPSFDEQSEIGYFFKTLDELITLKQKQLDLLKEQKKGFLQKMFPKAGEAVPEIRFAGFADDWEQYKLGPLMKQYSGKSQKNNQYPVLTSSRKGLFLQSEYYGGNKIASKDNTGYNVVPYGYFTYRHMSDDEVFKFNLNTLVPFGIVSTLYPVFKTTESLEAKYLQYQLNHGSEFSRYAKIQKQGGSRTYMYFSKLEQLKLTMPNSVSEQRKISGFLTLIDKTIALHQQKLDLLKELKKCFLQQMFI